MPKNRSIEEEDVIYLASMSPRRAEILTQIGVRFSVVNIQVEEKNKTAEDVDDYVKRLALNKARVGWQKIEDKGKPLWPVLAADTVGFFANKILEKPTDETEFSLTMRMLSGKTHKVSTAVAMKFKDREVVRSVITEVSFKEISDAEISQYWETGEPQDKACGYGIQGLGAVFVNAISGSYSGVVGLPIDATIELLELFHIPWWQQPLDVIAN